MREKILVVEDERIVAFNIQQRLARLGYAMPMVAASGADALRIAGETNPDLVLMDIQIEGEIDGIETASRLASNQAVPIIYLTGHADETTLKRARATLPHGYLLKPFSESEMHATIQMALERSRIESALQKREEQLRLALEAAEMGIVELDPDTDGIELAGHSAEIFGLDPDTACTRCQDLLQLAGQDDRPRLADALHSTTPFQIEYPRPVTNNGRRWVRIQGARYSRRARAKRSMIGIVQDVTERRANEEIIRQLNANLEQQVAARTAELQASMTELDAFSYSVAHDLRAPVRTMVTFSEMVLEEAGRLLDPESRRHLERIHAAGLHLAAMIDALLDLSRITRSKLNRRRIDLSTIATEIAAELREDEPGRAVEFVFASGMMAHADPDMMWIVLNNLLRNAWKFTSGHDRARIEFSSVAGDDGRPCFFVRDDGAGFEMAFAGKLFGAFQRMHPAGQFEGTGIGLATVRRIVNRHGGSIWAEAGVENGATFYFTLPDPV